MKCIRITFEVYDDNETVALRREFETSAVELQQSILPLLALTAEREAGKFWDATVAMGFLDEYMQPDV